MHGEAQMPFVALGVAAIFAAIHLVGRWMRFLDGTPRSIWLSVAGGIAVSYVFLHVLPELAVAHGGGEGAWYGERLLYLIAMAGLAAIYGAEKLVHRGDAGGGAARGFWLHIATYAVYNALIGYLLVHREVESALSLAIYALAMGVHFVANDWGLRQTRADLYRRYGRWLLAGAVLAGWGIGAASVIGERTVEYLFAFLAGGVIMNVLKEELPRERESRFGAFVAGLAGFSALLLLAE